MSDDSVKSLYWYLCQEKLDNVVWGGSGIERSLFEFILKTVKHGSVVLELGSGFCSTKAFSMFYRTWSVDDNLNYCGLIKPAWDPSDPEDDRGVNYVFAPFQDGWYSRGMIKALPKDYQLIFVDGPSGHNRQGILENLDLLNTDVPIIFHDTNRVPERDLAIAVANKLGKRIVFYDEGDFWCVIEGDL